MYSEFKLVAEINCPKKVLSHEVSVRPCVSTNDCLHQRIQGVKFPF